MLEAGMSELFKEITQANFYLFTYIHIVQQLQVRRIVCFLSIKLPAEKLISRKAPRIFYGFDVYFVRVEDQMLRLLQYNALLPAG